MRIGLPTIAYLLFVQSIGIGATSIEVVPSELHFVATKGDEPSAPAFLHVRTDDIDVEWSVEEDLEWLTVDRDRGKGPTVGKPIRLKVASRSVGVFEGIIRVRLNGTTTATHEIPVTANVVNDRRVLNVGNRKQLFIDERFIARGDNYELNMNAADKLGPVIEDSPSSSPGQVLSIFEDAGKYKMYYGAYTDRGCGIAYAESEDGIRWVKPELGIVEIAGSKANNLIYIEQNDTPEIAYIYLDPWDVSSRRYKMFVCSWHEPEDMKVDGVYGFYSADGLNFTKAGRVLPLCTDNPTVVQWDENIGKYVIFMRAFVPNNDNQRRVGRIVTDDLLAPWPFDDKSDYFRATDQHIPVVLKADDEIDRTTDLYYNNGTIYPWAQDAYLMFITPFRHFYPNTHHWMRARTVGSDSQGGWEDYGLIETQLAVSRDGIHWDRPERWPYFAMGYPDQWDRWLNVMGPGIIRHENDLYQYYMSSGRTHDGNSLRPEYKDLIKPSNKIGIVRQRLDGFISVDVDHRGGWIETPPIVFHGNELRLNINAGASGTAFVEIRDEKGNPIPGFTLDESDETAANQLNAPVWWKGNKDISSLAGKPIKLYFKLKQAKLYAFQFVHE